ncbi:FAD-dependent oxidoreductase [Cellulomonas aerilata]|uniref:FAD-binding domain-containing protein n=1 Tax=Cellulomonas aerilata TaxID=515326 RepID=A0A512DAQ3_9CELL|nr:NAD(P)/FAD-dependent oxidoreductase [Cellulomonas aerilata]GEO33554.1 hypothetical protein CAE01nite_12790 [Cellulomonas aerilata]
MHEHTDVLVVGAGPVGLALAAFLGRRGVTSVVVERRSTPTPRDESRAITWMPEGLLAADALGVTGDLRDRAVVRRHHDFLARPGGATLLRLDMTALDHPHRCTLNLPQHDTEEVLEAAASATGRTVVRRDVRVVAVESRPDGVAAVLRGSDGTDTSVTAAFGVACDGAGSTRGGVAGMLGVGSRFRDYGMDSVVADLELDDDPWGPDRSWIALDASRPLGAFCFAPHRWRLVYRVDADETRAVATSPELVAEQLDRARAGTVARRLLWASAFRLGQGQADAYTAGRWALAGDAAHAMGPSAGAGMQVGVLGAWRLSDHLAGAVRSPASWPAAAQAYESAQRRVSRTVQRSNARTFRAMAVTSPRAGAARAVALRGVGRVGPLVRRMTADAALVGLAPTTPSRTRRPAPAPTTPSRTRHPAPASAERHDR